MSNLHPTTTALVTHLRTAVLPGGSTTLVEAVERALATESGVSAEELLDLLKQLALSTANPATPPGSRSVSLLIYGNGKWDVGQRYGLTISDDSGVRRDGESLVQALIRVLREGVE